MLLYQLYLSKFWNNHFFQHVQILISSHHPFQENELMAHSLHFKQTYHECLFFCENAQFFTCPMNVILLVNSAILFKRSYIHPLNISQKIRISFPWHKRPFTKLQTMVSIIFIYCLQKFWSIWLQFQITYLTSFLKWMV